MPLYILNSVCAILIRSSWLVLPWSLCPRDKRGEDWQDRSLYWPPRTLLFVTTGNSVATSTLLQPYWSFFCSPDIPGTPSPYDFGPWLECASPRIPMANSLSTFKSWLASFKCYVLPSSLLVSLILWCPSYTSVLHFYRIIHTEGKLVEKLARCQHYPW